MITKINKLVEDFRKYQNAKMSVEDEGSTTFFKLKDIFEILVRRVDYKTPSGINVTFKVSPKITEEPPKIKEKSNKSLNSVNTDTDMELVSQGYVW